MGRAVEVPEPPRRIATTRGDRFGTGKACPCAVEREQANEQQTIKKNLMAFLASWPARSPVFRVVDDEAIDPASIMGGGGDVGRALNRPDTDRSARGRAPRAEGPGGGR